MKRTLYRNLHTTLRPYSGPTSSRVATAVLTVPDLNVPRWSPGPGWIEMATARYWRLPIAEGVDRVMVRTWGRDRVGLTEDDDVLLSGVLTGWHGIVADKHHRLYQKAEPGTLAAEVVTADHPAEVYARHFEATFDTYKALVERAQKDYKVCCRTLDLRPDCELRPDGRSWALSLQLSLFSDPDCYWWELARAADVLATISRFYGVPHVRLYSRDVDHLTDPLWHHGGNEASTG